MSEPTRTDTDIHHGTRVPVRSLFEHLAAGDALETFLDDFPTVPRASAVALLHEAADRAETDQRAAG